MSQKKTILIVEDNHQIAEQLKNFFESKGLHTQVYHQSEKALKEIAVKEFDFAFLDCMLPKLTGVQLAEQIVKHHYDTKIFLYSGVFKEAFIKAQNKNIPIQGFFSKPLDFDLIEQKLKHFLSEDSEASNEVLSDNLIEEYFFNKATQLKDIYDFLSNKKHQITNLEAITLVYLMIQHKFTGTVLLSSLFGDNNTLYFSAGQICEIKNKDRKSFFGYLAVKKGKITENNLKKILKTNQSHKIGERLVKEGYLNKNETIEILKEQMKIRLHSCLLPEKSYVELVNNKLPTRIQRDLFLSQEESQMFLVNKICPQLNDKTLKGFFDFKSHLSLESHIESFTNLNLAQRALLTEFFSNSVSEVKNLYSLLDQAGEQKQNLSTFFQALLVQAVRFKNVPSKNFKSALKRAQHILEKIQNKSPYEILNVNKDVSHAELKEAYTKMSLNFHEDRLDPEAPADLKQLYSEIFIKIKEAYEIFTKPEKKASFLKDKNQKNISRQLLYEKAKNLLVRGNYIKAWQNFEDLEKDEIKAPDFLFYYYWAQLKAHPEILKESQVKHGLFLEIEKLQIEHSPYQALFFFLKGLFFKLDNNFNFAKKFLNQALLIDPDFLSAKKELRQVLHKIKSKPIEKKSLLSSLFSSNKKSA